MPRQSPQAVSRGRFSCRPPLGVRRCVVHRTILRSRTPPGGAAQSNQVVAYSPGLAGCAGVSLPTPRRRYPFPRPPSVRGAHLECRFRSSPPTHHGGGRTRRHDGESRPCRRTPLGLLSHGVTPARGRGVNCKQPASRGLCRRRRRGERGAGASLKGRPFAAVQRRSARHTRAADRSGSAYGCRRASRRSRWVWPGAPPTSAHRRPKRPPCCSSRPPLAAPAAGGPVPVPNAPRRSPDGGASLPAAPPTSHFSRVREDDTPGVAHDQGW